MIEREVSLSTSYLIIYIYLCLCMCMCVNMSMEARKKLPSPNFPRSFPISLATKTFIFSSSLPPTHAICVGQILLGVRLALKCGPYTRCHSIKENRLSFSKQLSNINCSSERVRISYQSTQDSAGILSNLMCKSYTFCHN